MSQNHWARKVLHSERANGAGNVKADAEGRACYLESSNPINLVIYARLGFEFKKKIHLLRGKLPQELDVMVREPVSAAGKIGAKLKETRMNA